MFADNYHTGGFIETICVLQNNHFGCAEIAIIITAAKLDVDDYGPFDSVMS